MNRIETTTLLQLEAKPASWLCASVPVSFARGGYLDGSEPGS